MKLTKKFCFKCVAALLGLIALLMGCFSGLSSTEGSATAKAQLFGMMFGKWNITISYSSSSQPISDSMDGPTALAGLFAFILIILAIVAVVLSIFLDKNEKILLYVGAGLLALSAIFMFLLLAFGTDYSETVFGITSTTHYSDMVEDCALGAGAWLWAIFALGGAGVAAYASTLK